MEPFTLPGGFRAAGTWAGIKKEGRGLDLGLLLAGEARPCAAVFTRNALHGAHIGVCRDHLARGGGLVRAVLVNSGNANCATGEQGVADARAVCAALAGELGCPAEQVLFVSTGVIGARLPVERVTTAIAGLCGSARADGGPDFARAIMTTDTHPKVERRSGSGFAVAGFAKGAGMIHPDMATMLAFLLTDTGLGDGGAMLRAVADRSFHRLSIDGDTSPNDTMLLWGGGGEPAPGARDALLDASRALCRQIAADGEGATRLVTIEVRGAASEEAAARAGRTIATSPLVKTAVAGRDPNWGRILSAAGRAGVAVDVARARVWVGTAMVYEDGRPHPEREDAAFHHLRDEREVVLGVDLGVGAAAADVWTCDLTADYVRINADYRT